MKKSDLFFNVIRLPVDFGMLLLAGLTAYIFRTQLLSGYRPVLFQFNLPLTQFLYLVVFVSFVFLGAYAAVGLYGMRAKIGRWEEFVKIIIGSSAGIMLVIIFIFLRQELFNSRFLVLGGWIFAILLVTIGRQLVRLLQKIFVGKYDFGIHRVLLIGADEVAQTIKARISENPHHGYRIVGHIIEPDFLKIREIQSDIDEVILANPNYPADRVRELVDFCNDNHIVFKFIPNIYQTLTTNFGIDLIDRFPVIELKRTSLDGWGRVIKRSIDIAAASLGLLLTSPIFLTCALIIKNETKAPVFARLKRVSKNREFYLYKFRSMIANAEELKPSLIAYNERKDGPLFKMKDDPRVTRVGRILRRTRIDELPQFINILKGDISLVGPRPHQPDEIQKYEKHHKKVLAIKAGATGLAQISGSSDLPFDEEVAIDSFYIEHWSLLLDMRIIFRTFLKMFRDPSAV